MDRLTERVAELAEALQRKALADLTFHWTDESGHAAYRFSFDGGWLATRSDNGRVLSGSSPEELRVVVADDYAQEPVRRDDDCPRS